MIKSISGQVAYTLPKGACSKAHGVPGHSQHDQDSCAAQYVVIQREEGREPSEYSHVEDQCGDLAKNRSTQQHHREHADPRSPAPVSSRTPGDHQEYCCDNSQRITSKVDKISSERTAGDAG